jgi:hypothetical protein
VHACNNAAGQHLLKGMQLLAHYQQQAAQNPVWRTTFVTGVGRFSIIAVKHWLRQHKGDYLQPCGALTGHQ